MKVLLRNSVSCCAKDVIMVQNDFDRKKPVIAI